MGWLKKAKKFKQDNMGGEAFGILGAPAQETAIFKKIGDSAIKKVKKQVDEVSGKNARDEARYYQYKEGQRIENQTAMERAKAAEMQSEIERRKLLGYSGGRQSLLSRSLGG